MRAGAPAGAAGGGGDGAWLAQGRLRRARQAADRPIRTRDSGASAPAAHSLRRQTGRAHKRTFALAGWSAQRSIGPREREGGGRAGWVTQWERSECEQQSCSAQHGWIARERRHWMAQCCRRSNSNAADDRRQRNTWQAEGSRPLHSRAINEPDHAPMLLRVTPHLRKVLQEAADDGALPQVRASPALGCLEAQGVVRRS